MLGIVRKTCGIVRSQIGKILRPKLTLRKGVIALLLVGAIISLANESKVVRLSEYDVRDRSLNPLASALGVDTQNITEYTLELTARLEEAREPITNGLKAHISSEQQRRSNLILGILVALSFTGLTIILAPVVLARRYPRDKWTLARFSLLSALLFVVVGNIFVGIYALTRFAQSLVSTASNPQLSLTESTFNFLINNSGELAGVGPGIIEPTLRALEQDPSAPGLDTIIENVYRFTGEVEVYQTILGVVKVASEVFTLVPMLLLLFAFAFVLRNALPTMRMIVRLPEDAARGVERAGRTTIRMTARTISRELIYMFALIGVLLFVTFTIAATANAALEPALQVMLNYILASIVYIQLADEVRPGLVFVSVVTTLSYLVLGMTLTVGVAGIFLFKASRLLRHSTKEGFRSIQQRRFWLVGFGGLIWLMLFPVLYAQIIGSLVSGMIQLGVNAGAWDFIFVTPALVMLGMFFVSFWAVNGFRTIVFIWKFSPEEALQKPPEEPEPLTFPDAKRGSLLENVSIQVINDDVGDSEDPPDSGASSVLSRRTQT